MSSKLRKIQKNIAFTKKFVDVLNKHEQYLTALDTYIEKLENLLIVKGVFTRDEVTNAASETLEGLSTVKVTEEEVPSEAAKG